MFHKLIFFYLKASGAAPMDGETSIHPSITIVSSQVGLSDKDLKRGYDL